jgi:hypothetical protein
MPQCRDRAIAIYLRALAIDSMRLGSDRWYWEPPAADIHPMVGWYWKWLRCVRSTVDRKKAITPVSRAILYFVFNQKDKAHGIHYDQSLQLSSNIYFDGVLLRL